MVKNVLIGIQARSGSTRLPRKAFELIGGKMMLDHVIEACKKAAAYASKRGQIAARVVLLTPEGDPIATAFGSRCDVVEGSMDDVLSRYVKACDRYAPDLVVRITGDCPLIPNYVISRIIALAVQNDYDYVANVDERFRTSIDGTDCEAISAKLLLEVGRLAVSKHDKEHVTTLIRTSPPAWANIGAVLNHFDQSGTKLSVDTPLDLARAREAFDAAADKYSLAIRTFGQTRVHAL